MKSILTTTLILLYCIAAMAQTTVTTYTPGISTEGAAYYLPKTIINISITTEKTTYIPGELCQYADRYLRTIGISDKEDSYYTIKSATITTEGAPDEKKVYHIHFAANSVAPLVTLTESGILHCINTVPQKATTPNTSATTTPSKKILSARSYMTEEMLITGSKAKLAELVAKEIYNIRESKNLIIRGQNEHMPKDAESLQMILAGLQEQEEAFTRMFTGTTTTEISTQTYQATPTGSVDRVILGRFSRKLGLLPGDDLAGAPIYIDIKSKQSIALPTATSPNEKTKAKGLKKGKDDNKQDGLVYNIPGKADVKVYTNTQLLAEDLITIAQFGKTETLSSDLLSKKKDIKVTLDPITGALLHVED